MSENQDRCERDLSEYDSMSTEELEQLLRLDAETPEGSGSDTEVLFHIMEVLAQRRRNDPNFSGKTARQAYESFKQHYMPQDGEDTDIQFNNSTKPNKQISWLRRFAAVAAVLAILVLATVSVDAFGYDIFGKIATWSDEFFRFQDETQGTEATEPDVKDEMEYASLQDALDELEIVQKLAPQWFPEKCTLVDILVSNSPREISIYAIYVVNEAELTVSIRQLLGSMPEDVEKSEGFVEAYDSNGITYYIFRNLEKVKASWVVGEFECYISGYITVEEMRAIIDSI